MAFQFPLNPTIGQLYNPIPGTTYRWSGLAWYLVNNQFMTQTEADARYVQLTKQREKNLIINGLCVSAQYGTVNVLPAANAPGYGGCDRIYGAHTNATVFGLSRQTSTFSSSGYVQQLQLNTPAAGNATLGTRIEARDTGQLNGKTVTVGATAFHLAGAGITVSLMLFKANGPDVFTAPTLLAQTNPVPIAASTPLPLELTVALNGTDGDWGLQAQLLYILPTTVVGANFYIWDFQLTATDYLAPIELETFEVTLAKCQRYMLAFNSLSTADPIGTGGMANANSGIINIYHPVETRVPPAAVSVGNAFQLVLTDYVATAELMETIALNGSSTKVTRLFCTGTNAFQTPGHAAGLFMNTPGAWLRLTGMEL